MNAVVLTSTLYSDDSYMVGLYTDEIGFVTVSVKVGRRSTVRMSHLQPLTLLQVRLDGKPSQQIMQIKECQIKPGTLSAYFSPLKGMISQFIADALGRSLGSEGVNVGLFDFIANSVVELNNLNRGVENFHLLFLLKLTHYLGFFPNIQSSEQGEFFNMQDGCFEPQAPFHSNYIQPSESVVMAQLMRLDYSTAYLLDVNRAGRNRVLDYILQYYRLHIPTMGELKSLEVLRGL